MGACRAWVWVFCVVTWPDWVKGGVGLSLYSATFFTFSSTFFTGLGGYIGRQQHSLPLAGALEGRLVHAGRKRPPYVLEGLELQSCKECCFSHAEGFGTGPEGEAGVSTRHLPWWLAEGSWAVSSLDGLLHPYSWPCNVGFVTAIFFLPQFMMQSQ